VAITAELIAVRRRVKRDLPHMSWFHRRQAEPLGSTDEAAAAEDTTDESAEALEGQE
jgi:hypothetical protein